MISSVAELLNKSVRVNTPGFELVCEAQSPSVPIGIVSTCTEAVHQEPECDERMELVQRCLASIIRLEFPDCLAYSVSHVSFCSGQKRDICISC